MINRYQLSIKPIFFMIFCIIQVYAGHPLELAHRAHQKKNYRQAEKFYLQALKEKKNPAIVHYNLGNLYYETKELGLAIFHYEKVIQIAPQFKLSYHNLGKIYFINQQYRHSLAVFSRYLKINPLDDETHLLIGDIYRKIDLSHKALFHYDQANQIKPKNESGYIAKANLYVDLFDYRSALAELDKFKLHGVRSRLMEEYQADLMLENNLPYQAYSTYDALIGKIENATNREEQFREKTYPLKIKKIDSLLKANMTNLAISQLENLVKEYPHKNTGIYYLEDIYLAEKKNRQRHFSFLKDFYPKNRKESFRIIKNFLTEAYNQNNLDLIVAILQFTTQENIKDELVLFIKNKLKY